MRTLTSVALLLLATSAFAGLFDNDCSYTAPRNAAISVAGATRIVIVGRAGELKISGAPGTSEVRATGTACTSERSNLDDITLVATRSGSGVQHRGPAPESTGWRSSNNTLDFEVAVPSSIPLRIDDSSGELRVENVATTDIHDSSGALHVRGVNGDLSIDDSSGEITVEHVTGRVTIEDSSGSIDVDDAGSVDIPQDGSGEVDVRHVKHDVSIGSKGSGGVSVSDIGGDLIVSHKGSGGIDYERVSGRVDIPRRHRD